MKLSRLLALSSVAFALSHALPAFAQASDWTSRCRLQLADDSKPESGKYLFLTRGQTAGSEGRAELDYGSGVSARAAVYPTDAKDLLNPYSNLSLSVSYVTPGNGKTKPILGAVSFRAVGKDFNAIPGAPVTMKLLIDGVTFGPYQPKPVSTGMYSVWLDTADTDGDGSPPTLAPADFAKLAKAMESVAHMDLVLVRDGVDLARARISTPQLFAWRDGLSSWATKTSTGVGVGTSCPGGGEILH